MIRDLGTALRALAFVEWRTWLWRIRRLRRNTWAVVAILAGIGFFVMLQVVATGEEPGAVDDMVGILVFAGVGMLFMASLTAVRVSPVRMRGADVAWVVPRPQGPRALVAWHVAVVGLRTVLIAGVGTLITAVIVRSLPAWEPLVAIWAALAVVQGAPTLAHMVGVRLGRAMRNLLMLAVPAWWLSVGLTAADAAMGLDWLPEAVRVVGRPGVWLLETLVGSVLTPGSVDGLGWAALVALAIVVAAVCLASGYEEGAAMRTWEADMVRAAVSDGSLTGEVMSDAIAKQVSRGVTSLERSFGLRGEWALMWVTLATFRRTWLRELRITGVALAVAAVLAVLAPAWAWIPAALWAFLVVVSLPVETAMQRAKPGLHMMPGSPTRKLAALDIGSGLSYLTGVVLAAIPWLVVARLGWGGTIGLFAVTVAATVALTAASGVATLIVTSTARQFGLGMLAVTVTCGLLALGALLTAGVSWEAGVIVMSTLVSVGCWLWGATLLDRGRAE